ncbi:MAG: hypothetical protein RL042_402 [Nitrospirota bacterium]
MVGWTRGALSLSSSFEGGHPLGEGPSIDLFHLGHDIFDGFGHQAHERAMSCPIHRIPKALDERCWQGDRNSLLLWRRKLQHRFSIEGTVVDGSWLLQHICHICRESVQLHKSLSRLRPVTAGMSVYRVRIFLTGCRGCAGRLQG